MSGLSHMRQTSSCREALDPEPDRPLEANGTPASGLLDSDETAPFVRNRMVPLVQGRAVLLVLPNNEYRNSLAENLRGQGFVVNDVATAQAAIALIVSGEKFHVIVIAEDLPDLTGVEALSRLRDLGIRTPIALLADVYSEIREEVALGCGAAEFICRSRRPSIIVKRLYLLAGGAKLPAEDKLPSVKDLKIGELVLKSGFHRAIWRGAEVPLTVTEVRIVRLLACQAGTALSYREIYDVVHGAGFSAGEGSDGYRINVRSLIRKIRKRFRAIDSSFDRIENCQGFGYRWRDQPAGNSGPDSAP